ncbi:SE1561 family protein [Aquibacillus rhizosphaerae]|uniref:SE1561 family protein n=1 Tax=Aquibacillus rhizosphaerae TaxID=3051431 RepID=A0ABT7LBB8_9BACI|nr:SE1561 family protein [Aquibacillus sp. LR5S19]MDL4841836.1 SE1561 family protein [Aquibacillus sp. LR5S19]
MTQQAKIDQLKVQLSGFLEQLESLDPSKTSVEDIDSLIEIIEKLEADLH